MAGLKTEKGEIIIFGENRKFARSLTIAAAVLLLFTCILCMTSFPAYATENTNTTDNTEIAETIETAEIIIYHTYQIGSRGEEVSNIQSRLNFLGFDSGAVDGVFGSMTAQSVRAFQTTSNLEPNGIVDAKTYRALIGRDIPVVSRSAASHLAARRIVQTAMNYVGVPYRYGGNTPRGFDCSGFTRFIFGQAGINLPRMADGQYLIGEPVSRNDLQTGDLVFFTTYASGASHVGIYLDNGLFISATSSRGVRVTSLSDSYWGPRYIGARRVL